MTTDTTTRVRCPACQGFTLTKHGDNYRKCSLCHGSGTLDADEWLTCTDPARMVAMLGAVGVGEEEEDERFRSWVAACRRLTSRNHDNDLSNLDGSNIEFLQGSVALWSGANGYQHREVPFSVRCNILRCLFPNPLIERERVECPECDELTTPQGRQRGKVYEHSGPESRWVDCSVCNGSGFIPAPRIDPRWLSSTVLDLARTIRNQLCEYCGATLEFDEGSPGHREEPPTMSTWFCANCGIDVPKLPAPLFDRMPILADALMDAGCDDEELLNHCRGPGPHVSGCWVIAAILTPAAADPPARVARPSADA